jgi:hypothetical protein
MEPREAVLTVLREERGPLHWTKVLDAALRNGSLDPFEHPDVRRVVQTALHALAREGLISHPGKGVYEIAQLDEDDD